MPIILSIVVPTMDQESHLKRLLDSFDGYSSDEVEIVVVNQSGKKLRDSLIASSRLPIAEHLPAKVIPAAEARNKGAELARGSYLLFLDEDASLYSGKAGFNTLLRNIPYLGEIIIVQRGEVADKDYISHWPPGAARINIMNFPGLIIEWNIIIKKDLFRKLGGFPRIGKGCPHAAQSGEAFVLMAKALGSKTAIGLFPDIKIAHPSLERCKSIENTLGYAYGAGYAVALGLRHFNLGGKVYWWCRIFAASLREILFNGERSGLKWAGIKCKLLGFLDALRALPPRSKNWLGLEAGKAKNE